MLGLDITTLVIAFSAGCMGGIFKGVYQDLFRKKILRLLFLIDPNRIKRALFT